MDDKSTSSPAAASHPVPPRLGDKSHSRAIDKSDARADGPAVKKRVSATAAQWDEIDTRAALAGFGRSAYLVRCATGHPAPPVRHALPPDPEARAILEQLLVQLELSRRSVRVMLRLARVEGSEGNPWTVDSPEGSPAHTEDTLRRLNTAARRLGRLAHDVRRRL